MLTIVTPKFNDAGQLISYVVDRGHQRLVVREFAKELRSMTHVADLENDACFFFGDQLYQVRCLLTDGKIRCKCFANCYTGSNKVHLLEEPYEMDFTPETNVKVIELGIK